MELDSGMFGCSCGSRQVLGEVSVDVIYVLAVEANVLCMRIFCFSTMRSRGLCPQLMDRFVRRWCSSRSIDGLFLVPILARILTICCILALRWPRSDTAMGQCRDDYMMVLIRRLLSGDMLPCHILSDHGRQVRARCPYSSCLAFANTSRGMV